MNATGSRWAVSLAILASLSLSALASEPTAISPLKQVGTYALRDLQGTEHNERELSKTPATVIVFLGLECPVSNGYAPEFARLAKDCQQRGIAWFGVHADPDVTAAIAARHAKDFGLNFPILLDGEQQLARQLGVTTMPEAAVVRRDGAIVYRGRIDDRYTELGQRREVPQTRELFAAIEAVAKGELPQVRETRAFGCPLPRK